MTRPRFLVVAGTARALAEAGNAVDIRSAAPLVRHDRTPGLIVFATSDTPVLELPEGQGFVIGRIFSRDAREPLEDVGPELGRNIFESRGQVLIENHWGEYAAIGGDDASQWALRDPSGAVPLYRARAGRLLILFSDLKLPLECGLIEPRLDPDFAAHWLAYPALRTQRTGLAGIAEVLPGTRVVHTAGELHEETSWAPWRFASRRTALSDFEAARDTLRQQLTRTIAALASGHDHLLLELSGGLDSALIAAALRNAGQHFTAVNFATNAPDGDERHYARAIAEHVGTPLVELLESDTSIDLTPPGHMRLRPAFSPVVQPLHRAFAEHAREVGAGAFLTGTGGDNIFCYLTTAAPILDALRSGRPWHAVTCTLGDVAAQCDCTLWTAARFTLSRLVRGSRRAIWKCNPDFLVPEAVPPQPDHHPWLYAPRGTLPGKREHVEALVRIQHFLDPANRETDLPFVHPLMAQPLLELCLTIPSWLWVTGGYNRAVARAAFEDRLPRLVIDRRTKGRLESMCATWFAAARDALREMVLDGELRRRGIVDGNAVESYLGRQGVPRDERYFRIFEIAAVELWLSGWRGRPSGGRPPLQ
jgi:asparagine synthase (glutamine-hydrolysing)